MYFTSVSTHEEGVEETGALFLGTCTMTGVSLPQGLTKWWFLQHDFIDPKNPAFTKPP